MARHSARLLVLLLCVVFGKGDYSCICFNGVQRSIYAKMDRYDKAIGLLYDGDCLPKGPDLLDFAWFSVQYQHQIAYIENDASAHVKTCSGNAQTNHLAPTTATTATTSTTSTPAPTTTITTIPSTFTTTTLKLTTTTPLHLATTTAMPQVSNTTTAMPQVSNTDGDISMCPGSVKQDSRLNNYPLAQHGDSCYELQTHMATWLQSETLCTQQGGHMVAITSAAEQAFVNTFMARHNPEHAVWIGLHDRTVEDQFEWTSGESVSYTNWVPNHRSNFESHNTEDCVALIPYQSSKWDDIPCGQHGVLFGGAVGEKHYALCEYKVVASHGSSVLVG